MALPPAQSMFAQSRGHMAMFNGSADPDIAEAMGRHGASAASTFVSLSGPRPAAAAAHPEPDLIAVQPRGGWVRTWALFLN